MTADYMHRGSRENLLGPNPDETLAKNLSNDLPVTAQTPPTFIFQTDEDKGVKAENCVAYYLALSKAGVPAELHIYEKGPHGVGLAKNIPSTNSWPQRCTAWLEGRGLLKAK